MERCGVGISLCLFTSEDVCRLVCFDNNNKKKKLSSPSEQLHKRHSIKKTQIRYSLHFHLIHTHVKCLRSVPSDGVVLDLFFAASSA